MLTLMFSATCGGNLHSHIIQDTILFYATVRCIHYRAVYRGIDDVCIVMLYCIFVAHHWLCTCAYSFLFAGVIRQHNYGFLFLHLQIKLHLLETPWPKSDSSVSSSVNGSASDQTQSLGKPGGKPGRYPYVRHCSVRGFCRPDSNLPDRKTLEPNEHPMTKPSKYSFFHLFKVRLVWVRAVTSRHESSSSSSLSLRW